MNQLRHILTHVLVLQYRLIIAVEIRREINQNTLVSKGLAPIGDVLLRARRPLLLFVKVLKRLALHQVQYQVSLVGTRR